MFLKIPLCQNLYSIMFSFLIKAVKRGTVYLYRLQYYDIILQNLTRKTAEIAFAGIYISKFSGGPCPRTPLECLAHSALATRPPKTITLATPLLAKKESVHTVLMVQLKTNFTLLLNVINMKI